MRTIHAADLFCGAGGTSTGVAQACRNLGYGLDLLAINHWDIAIATHSKNYPGMRHICWPVKQIGNSVPPDMASALAEAAVAC